MLRADNVNQDVNIEGMRQSLVNQTGIATQFGNRPAVICRQGNCTRLNDRITRTYLFNTLSNIFMLNSHSKMNICEADPFTRSCLQSGISFPAYVGIANALIKIPQASINQVTVSTGLSQTKLALSYTVLVNGIETQCSQTTAEILVPNEASATLTSPNFTCNLTSDGTSSVSLMLSLDYIDLDYGIMGGYYSLGMQGPAQGGGTGYMLFKLEYTSTNSGKDTGRVAVPQLRTDERIDTPANTLNAITDEQSSELKEGEVRMRAPTKEELEEFKLAE
jgi:hypothetical protein